MRKGIIDRFEGEYAVIEFDRETEDMLRSELPAEIKPGDTLIFDGDTITVDAKDTASRKEKLMT